MVIIPVDLERDEIVLIRQFRLGAHLALGKGDMVEVPAGRVERGEDGPRPRGANVRKRSAWRRGADPDVRPDAVGRLSDEHMFFFLAVVDASQVPERAGAAHEQEELGRIRVTIDRALEALETGGCITARR